MKWIPLFCLTVFPTLLAAYESPRDGGLYLSASVGTGVFLNSFDDGRPLKADFREFETTVHGMSGSATDKRLRFGGGFSLGYLTVDQKACGLQGCPAPNEEMDANPSAVFSPHLRFEWHHVGLQLGVTYLSVSPIPLLPRLALRLGPSEALFMSLEFLNGNPFLSEGFIKVGVGGTLLKSQIWVGGETFPYDGFGLGVKVSRDFGPLRAFLGGHVGQGRDSYRDLDGNAPAFDTKILESGLTLGLEFRIPD